jgi:hypothetical protein
MLPRTKIKFASLEGIRKLLRAVPQRDRTPQEVSKSEAVRHLLPDILELQGKGHDLDNIARILTESGLPVSMWTVKNILVEAEEGAKATPAAQPPPAPRKSRGNGTPAPSGGTAARSTLVQATASEGPSAPGTESQSRTQSESQSRTQSESQSESQSGSQSKTQAARPLGTQSREVAGVPGVEVDRADRENTGGDAARTVARGSANARPEAAIASAGGQSEVPTRSLAGGSEHPPDPGAEKRSGEGGGDRSPAESGARAARAPESEAAARFARLPETPTPDSQAKPQRRSAFTIRPDTERI